MTTVCPYNSIVTLGEMDRRKGGKVRWPTKKIRPNLKLCGCTGEPTLDVKSRILQRDWPAACRRDAGPAGGTDRRWNAGPRGGARQPGHGVDCADPPGGRCRATHAREGKSRTPWGVDAVPPTPERGRAGPPGGRCRATHAREGNEAPWEPSCLACEPGGASFYTGTCMVDGSRQYTMCLTAGWD